MLDEVPIRVVVAAVVSVVCLALLRGAGSSRAAFVSRTRKELRYTAGLKAFGVLVAPAIAGLGMWMMFTASNEQLSVMVVGIPIGGGLACLGTYSLFELLWVRIEFDDEGITSYVPWRRVRHMPWKSILRVAYSRRARWIVVRSVDGTVFRASTYLSGIRDLFDELRKRVPPACWEPGDDPFADLR